MTETPAFARPIIRPPRLREGDRVALVTVSAPEAAQNPDRVERGLAYLHKLGLDPVPFPHAFASTKAYLAAEPEELAQDINAVFADPSIKAVICTGGGTNANRLLPYLDYDLMRAHPKVLVGMSNPAVVLNAVYARSGLITFHGPVLVWNLGDPDGLTEPTLASFRATLWRPTPPGKLVDHQRSWRFLRPGRARGRLLGGNLWTIQSLLGTPYCPSWEGALFFWEDIAKEPRRIDAALTHFRLAGVFDQIAGMIIGRLVECEATGPSLNVPEIVADLTKDYSFPILYDVLFGHTDDKLTLPLGVQATIDSATGTFSIDEAAVE